MGKAVTKLPEATIISAEELVLCATTEGTIYKSNVLAARYAATLPELYRGCFWRDHLRYVVMPALTGPGGGYRGEHLWVEGGNHAGGEALAAYYAEHVAEIDRDAIEAGLHAREAGWQVFGMSSPYGRVFYAVGPAEKHSNGFTDTGAPLGADDRPVFQKQDNAWREAARLHALGLDSGKPV